MKLLDFLVADDVRNELGNKTSVMGIISDGLGLNLPSDVSWPIAIRLGLYIRTQIVTVDKIPDKFLLTISLNKDKLAELGGDIVANDKSKLLTLPLNISQLPLTSYGVLEFQLDIFSNEENIFSTHSPFPLNVFNINQ